MLYRNSSMFCGNYSKLVLSKLNERKILAATDLKQNVTNAHNQQAKNIDVQEKKESNFYKVEQNHSLKRKARGMYNASKHLFLLFKWRQYCTRNLLGKTTEVQAIANEMRLQQ